MKFLSMLSSIVYAIACVIGLPIAWLKLALEGRGRRVFVRSDSSNEFRVAYCLTDLLGGLPGGAASHKAGFCKGLAALGHSVTVIASEGIVGLESVVKDYHIVPPPDVPKSFPVTLNVWANNIRFVRYASRLLKSRRPDVICQRHSHMNYSALILSRIFKVPFILEYNSPANWKSAAARQGNPLVAKFKELVERLNVAAADRIMVVSGVLKEELVKRGVPAEKVAVNPNGADAEMFRPDLDPKPARDRFNLHDKIVVGFAGHHNSNNTWHGTKFLAQAVGKVAEQRNDVQFLFIGDKGLVDLVSATVTPQSRPFVTFATSIPHPEMPSVYSACDLLVSPHVHMADGSTFFGSPVKIFEYMAMAKPIVASNVGQLAELLEDRVNALLTEPADVDAIARHIITLAGDAELRNRLGHAARETCLAGCTWKHNAARFINAFEACHSSGPKQQPEIVPLSSKAS
jgi:glycosyltransferase involved in cell wall biosynthesis